VNKALEVMEAHWFFGLPYDAIDVVVHPQSIVHSMVEFVDGSVVSQMGFPTMELPILYALTHPDRLPDSGTRFDPVAASPLTFEPVDHARFPAFGLGLAAARAGGTAPAASMPRTRKPLRPFWPTVCPFRVYRKPSTPCSSPTSITRSIRSTTCCRRTGARVTSRADTSRHADTHLDHRPAGRAHLRS
jgi:hypothetical protein